jgi:hypothetical protein
MSIPVIRLMMAGDSNTANAGHLARVQAETDATLVGTRLVGWAWPNTIRKVRTLPHEGYPGEGIYRLLVNLPRAIQAWKPAILILNIGANDCWRSLKVRKPIDAAQTKKVCAAWVRLAQMIEASGVAVVPVLLATPRNAPAPVAALRKTIAAWAKTKGRPVADAARCQNDGIHFTDAGYAALAQREAKAVFDLLVAQGRV